MRKLLILTKIFGKSQNVDTECMNFIPRKTWLTSLYWGFKFKNVMSVISLQAYSGVAEVNL